MHNPSAPFTDERLTETLVQHIGVGADSAQPASVRFLRSVQSVVRKRINSDFDSEYPAVFLLNHTRDVPDGARRMGMIDNGNKALEGQIWYVGPSLGFARALAHDCADDDVALFDLVRDQLGEGTTPTVLLLPQVSRESVRYYPLGLDHEDDFEVISVVASVVTLDQVFETLDRVHNRQLITPIAQSETSKLWAKSDDHHPVRKAELVAQSYVSTALWAAFGHCRVEVEYTQRSGRLDVALLGYDLSGGSPAAFCHVVLELKVLRSFGSTGRPVSATYTSEWVNKGVEQAFTYALEMNARAKALCCFDMRESETGDQCFSHIEEKASELGVALKKWHLYGRLEDYRADVVRRALRAP